MSNRAYLCGTDPRSIYPSFQAPRRIGRAFVPAEDTLLECAGCVPLAWLLLFHEDDMHEEVFATRDGDRAAVAPVVDRQIAVGRLRKRAPWVSQRFRALGNIAPHLELFANYVASYPHEHVTMEIEEIEMLYDEDEVLDLLLAAWDGLEARDEEVVPVLVDLSTLMLDVRVPQATELATATREESHNFFRLLGGGWMRPAPWDPSR